jgi:DNA-3-methyladenine glycosylase II
MSHPTVTIESSEIQHLRIAYPQLKPFFEEVGSVNLPVPSKASVADALIFHIVGQMLSAKAASTIYRRVVSASEDLKCQPWHLEESQLLKCGLSRRKTRAIREFGLAYDERADEIELWRSMPYPSLQQEIRAFWGISDWTAAMLAIFHFGHRDVFPLNDSSISRVIALIETHFLRGKGSFDPTPASPFGTHLALIFWASLDRGYWKQR